MPAIPDWFRRNVFALLGWAIAVCLAFFAIDESSRVTALTVTGTVATGMVAAALIVLPFILSYVQEKRHLRTVQALTPTRAVGFVEVVQRPVTDHKSVVVDVRNFNMASAIEITGVTVDCGTPGLRYRCTTHLPINVAAACPTGPVGFVQLSLIEEVPPASQHAGPFIVMVKVSMKLNGQLDTATYHIQVPV